MIKSKPYQTREHRKGNSVNLQAEVLPKGLRQEYTPRDLEMFRKGFVVGRIGKESLEVLEKKLMQG